MSLLDQIKADQVEARKARDPANSIKASLLTTLIGEVSPAGKDADKPVVDTTVIGKIKSFIANIDLCIEKGADGMQKAALLIEKAILDSYLPKQLTAEQMVEVIKRIRAEKGAKLEMKDIMGTFKAELAGFYDGKLLSEVAKTYLSVQV